MAKSKQKYTKKQKALLREVEKDPEASNYEITKRLNGLGVVKSNNYTDQLLGKNIEIRDKVTKLRERYELQTVKLFPKAKKVVVDELKNGNLDAAKLVYKHALPTYDESKRPPVQQTVNIQEIRTIIFNDMKDEDVIDVSDDT
jgi:hypothetical protein